MKNDKLKKQHFWILFGLVPLFVLISVFVISSGVGGAIDARNDQIKKSVDEIKSKSSPKPNVLLDKLDETIKAVDGKRGGLWKSNWDRQKDIYTWPQSSLFANFSKKDKEKNAVVPARLEDLKFGDQIVATADQFGEFRKDSFYLAQYSTATLKDKPAGVVGMADMIAPTQFNGGWQRLLRHVNSWSEYQLSSEQVWLLMEDLWVQRSMLQAIKSVNDEMGMFRRVKYEKGGQVIDDPEGKGGPQDPLRRKFRSRTWEVALEVQTKGNKQFLVGSLENITDRLQVLGIGKTLTLKVWLEANVGPDGKPVIGPDGKPDVAGIEPVEFRIGSEFLPGKGGKKTVKDKSGREITVDSNIVTIQPDENNEKDLDKYPNLLPPGKRVAEIVKVEQVFDAQTVPVRRIEAMALGYPDSRWSAIGALYPPKFITVEAVAGTGAGGGLPSDTGGSGSSQGPPPAGPSVTGASGGGGSVGPLGGDPRGGNKGSGFGASAGGGTVASVIEANKRRYVEVNDQVRRMPVGIVVVVDQAYIQHVMLAFANSPLRFQITQVTWNRFRGNLGTGSAGSGSAGGNDVFLSGTGSGSFGMGFGRGADPDLGSGRGPLGRPPVEGGSSQGPRPMGPPPIGPGQPPGGPITGGGTGGYDPYSEMGGPSTAVSEAQLTSGLVELSLYGIVSLYEKYPTPVAEGEPMEKKNDAPTDGKKDEKPKDALPPASSETKKRVRRRTA